MLRQICSAHFLSISISQNRREPREFWTCSRGRDAFHRVQSDASDALNADAVERVPTQLAILRNIGS